TGKRRVGKKGKDGGGAVTLKKKKNRSFARAIEEKPRAADGGKNRKMVITGKVSEAQRQCRVEEHDRKRRCCCVSAHERAAGAGVGCARCLVLCGDVGA